MDLAIKRQAIKRWADQHCAEWFREHHEAVLQRDRDRALRIYQLFCDLREKMLEYYKHSP